MGLVTSNDPRDPQKKRKRRSVVVIAPKKPPAASTSSVVTSPVKDTIRGGGGELRTSSYPEKPVHPVAADRNPAKTNARARAAISAYERGPSERDPLAQFLGKVGGAAEQAARTTHTSKQGAAVVSALQPAGKVAEVGLGEIVPRAAHQLAHQAIWAVPGLAQAAYPAAHDVVGLANPAILPGGATAPAPFEKSRKFYPALGKSVVHETIKDFEDPRGRPGYLLTDALAAASAGGAALERAGMVGAAAREAGAAGAGPLRAAGAGVKAAATRPRPTEFPLTMGSDQGGVTVDRLLSRNPLVRQVQTLANRERQRRLNNPTRQTRLGAPTKQELVDKYGMHPRVAAALDKVFTPQAKTGQLISRHFGPEATVSRELRAAGRVESALANAPAAELRHAAGPELGTAPVLERLPKRLRRGITRHEHKAIQALSIFGDEAVVNPARAAGTAAHYFGEQAAAAAEKVDQLEASLESLNSAASHAEQTGAFDEVSHLHQQIAETRAALEDVRAEQARHELQVSDFHAAQAPLERLRDGTASEHFQQAARLTRELSERRKRQLQGFGLLDPESAAFREAAPAAVLRGEPLTTKTHEIVTRAERPAEVVQLERALADVDKKIGQVKEQYRRSAKRQRPRTIAEAKAELARLEKEHEGLIGRFEKSLMSHPISADEVALELQRVDQELARHRGTLEDATAKIGRMQTDVRAGLTHDELAKRYGFSSNTGVLAGGTYGGELVGKIGGSKKAIARLVAERKRYEEAGKTGRLRVPHDKAETARRNLMRMQGAKVPTQAEELRDAAMRAIEDAIAKNPEHPSFRRFVGEQAQLERLREGLQRADPIFGEGLTTPGADRAAAASAMRATIDAPTQFGEEVAGEAVKPTRAKGDAEARSHYFGTVPVGADESARQRIGGLLEYRQGLSDRMDKALGRRPISIETIIDRTVEQRRELGQVPGAFRTPLSSAKARQKVQAPFVITQPSEYGVPLPKPGRRDAALTHQFTGGEVVHGDLTADPVSAMIDSYYRGTQVVSNLRNYSDLWRASQPARLHEGMVPIRNIERVPDVLKRARRKPDRNLPITKDELAALDAGDLGAVQSYVLQPLRASDGTRLYAGDVSGGLRLDVPLGWKDPHGEIRWVDERLFERYGNTKLPEPVRAVFDSINNPARGLLIYGKGGYILNLPSNWIMQGVEQGWRAPGMYRRAFTFHGRFVDQLVKEGMTPAEAEQRVNRLDASMQAVVGEGKARAYNIDTGVGHRALGALAQFWSNFIDRQSRLSSLLYHAHEKGINVDDFHQLDRLMHSEQPAARRTRVAVVRRANKAMADFTSLTPVERNIVRHVLFVYPWVSRATVWAARTLLEHPGKSFTLGQLARVGEARQQAEFGKLPGYQEASGDLMVHLGGKAARVGTASVSPFITAPQTLSQLKGLVTGPNAAGEEDPSQALSPAAGILLDTFRGTKRQGPSGGVIAAVQGLLKSLPQAQALRRAGVNKIGSVSLGPAPNPRKPLAQQPILSSRGLLPAAGYFGLGTAYPQEENLAAAHARRREEDLAAMPVPQRAVAREQARQSDWTAQARKKGLLGPQERFSDDPQLGAALRNRYVLAHAYGERAVKLGVGVNRLNTRDRLEVEAEILQRQGVVAPGDVTELKASLEKMSDKELRRTQHYVLSTLFGQSRVSDLKKVLQPA